MKALTPRQQALWDMKEAGRSNLEIGQALGISVNNVAKTLTIIRGKLGLKRAPFVAERNGAEHRRPEMVAAAIDAAADPASASNKEAIDRVNEILKASGMPGKVSEALVRRIKVKYADAVTVTRELRTKDILEMLGNRIDLAFSYLDDKVLAEASARDIMLGLGVMLEKRNLLRGEPTAIISDHERKKLHELLPMAIKEAQRRGLTVQGQITERVIEPA